uniref:phytanoyl-CoA dioxygenase n=1 Tax=Timema monikensis TaxID=170555 RepID=A0A7R9HUE5_9NEOP|nr:unnamed protein product [Timema monikensis]
MREGGLSSNNLWPALSGSVPTVSILVLCVCMCINIPGQWPRWTIDIDLFQKQHCEHDDYAVQGVNLVGIPYQKYQRKVNAVGMRYLRNVCWKTCMDRVSNEWELKECGLKGNTTGQYEGRALRWFVVRMNVKLVTEEIYEGRTNVKKRNTTRCMDVVEEKEECKDSTSVAIPQFMKKIHKSLYGTVRFTVPATWCLTVCACAHRMRVGRKVGLPGRESTVALAVLALLGSGAVVKRHLSQIIAALPCSSQNISSPKESRWAMPDPPDSSIYGGEQDISYRGSLGIAHTQPHHWVLTRFDGRLALTPLLSRRSSDGEIKTPHDTSVSDAVCTEFLYTLNNSRLSWYQRKFYDDNGFLLIRRLVDDDVLDACSSPMAALVLTDSSQLTSHSQHSDIYLHFDRQNQRFVDICEGRVPKGNMILMKDISLINTGVTGEFLYNKVQDIVWDEVMTKYIFLPKLLDYVECFTGPNIMAIHTMLINKPPDSGKMTSIHPLHQDLHYFPFRPADRIVAAWTAMEKVTMDNGCLVVIPGTHKGKLEQHDYPETENGVNKGYHGVKGFEDLPLVTLEMDKGDTVFFHPKLVHGSGVNKTKGFRKAISSHYASSDCHCIEVKGTTQEKVSQEIEEMAKKRGFELDYQTLWKMRSRVVRGVQSSL